MRMDMRSFIELPELRFSGNWFVTILPDDDYPIHFLVRNNKNYDFDVSVLLRKTDSPDEPEWVWDIKCPDEHISFDYRRGDVLLLKLIELLGE